MDYIPKRKSEANVQAELYSQLKAAGFVCELEYKVKRPGERGARLDVIIIQDGQIPAIIEVKNHAKPEETKANWKQRAQYMRYSRFGVPVLICPAAEYIPEVIEQVREIVEKAGRVYPRQNQTS